MTVGVKPSGRQKHLCGFLVVVSCKRVSIAPKKAVNLISPLYTPFSHSKEAESLKNLQQETHKYVDSYFHVRSRFWKHPAFKPNTENNQPCGLFKVEFQVKTSRLIWQEEQLSPFHRRISVSLDFVTAFTRVSAAVNRGNVTESCCFLAVSWGIRNFWTHFNLPGWVHSLKSRTERLRGRDDMSVRIGKLSRFSLRRVEGRKCPSHEDRSVWEV